MQEIWKDIEGYKGLYQISNLGRVKSLKKGNIRVCFMRSKYLAVLLCKNGVTRYYSIHRLIANAFIPNPDNLPQVNHKNADKLDNSIENLEWITAKGNMRHMAKLGLNPHTKLDWNLVSEIRGRWLDGFRNISALAREYGIKRSAMQFVINFRNWNRVP